MDTRKDEPFEQHVTGVSKEVAQKAHNDATTGRKSRRNTMKAFPKSSVGYTKLHPLVLDKVRELAQGNMHAVKVISSTEAIVYNSVEQARQLSRS